MHTIESAAAIAAAEQDVLRRPGDFSAFEQLGSAYFDEERYDDALAAYRRAIELNPNSANAYESIGHIFYRKNDPPSAIAAYEQAIAIDPHYTVAYFGLGILHSTKTGDKAQAIEAYQRGLAANPGDPFLTTQLGGAYARMGQVSKAVELLEEVSRAAPRDPQAWSWLNLLYLHQGRYDEALEACRRLAELEDDHSSYRLMGFIHYHQGRLQDAAAAHERAIAIWPADYEARAALARVYHETGRLDEARDLFNTAWKDAWEDHQEYGQACVQAVYGNVDQALALLETALQKGLIDPGWVRIDPEFAFIQDDPRFIALLRQEA